MKRAARPARRDQVTRQLATPLPAWNGHEANVQLSDWAAFASANRLSVTRSFITGEVGGWLQVVVHVETSDGVG